MIWLVVGLIVCFGAFFFLAEMDRPLAALVAIMSAVVFMVILIINVNAAEDPAPPVPSVPSVPTVLPSHGPDCADLAWLDGRWTCIPMEERG